MKKEKKQNVAANAQAVTKPVAPSAFARVEERVNAVDVNGTKTQWTTNDEYNNIVGYDGIIKTKSSIKDVLSTESADWVTAVPSNLLTYLSLEYSVEEIKKVVDMELPNGLVTKLTLTDNGNIRLFLDKNKLKELPNKQADNDKNESNDESNRYRVGLVDKCYNNVLSTLGLDKFPDTMMTLAADTGSEFKVSAEGIIIDIKGKDFIANRILPSIIREENIKGYPLSNIKLSDIKINGDRLFFALTFKNRQVTDSITVSNKTLVVARFSMTHEIFAELSKPYLDTVAVGAKIKFADVNSVTGKFTDDEDGKAKCAIAKKCIETNGFEVFAVPVIDITGADSLYKKGSTKEGFKNPILNFSLPQSANGISMSYLNYGHIRKKLNAVIEGTNVLTYVLNESTIVLPNIKKLVLASVFDGDIPSNLKVSWASDNTKFGFSLSL